MITVMGATGHTGKEITDLLLKAGENVRALGRSESKLAALKAKGAEVLPGDFNDTSYLTEAFRGANAVYTLLPANPQSTDYRAAQNALGETILQAIRNSGVRRVVFLSSVGADQSEGTGILVGLHLQEQRLRTLPDTDILILRPGSFFENFYGSLDLIKQQEINGDAVAPDVRIPMIAVRDIAVAASQAPIARNGKGIVVRELLGERDLSYSQATRLIGEAIGQPNLPYIPFADADMIGMFVQMGLSEDFARRYVEFAQALSDGRIRSCEGRTPENTTPTRFEDFATELARAYQAI